MATVSLRSAANRSRPKSSEEDGKSLWSSLLESVATSKRLPEKTLLILGGTVETQKNFLAAIASDSSQRRRPTERSGSRNAVIANRFALGYTYQDVLDSDQDDVLARLSEFLLTEPQPAFTPLLQPLFSPKTVPDIALTILLDWGEPWNWLRQLRDWLRAIRSVLAAADANVQDALEENMQAWRQRRKGPRNETPATHDYDASLPMTLGPGEWDEALGVPLCVVCQNAEKIEILEREHGWKEYEFDTVLIYLRTILLKHGASLIYTASAAPGALQSLLRSTLDIHSILQKNALKHNVNDRDKVMVPPNWDSWGKIRPLREGFDFETVSKGWSVDIEPEIAGGHGEASESDSAIASYEELIRNPHKPSTDEENAKPSGSDGIEIRCESNQEFFARQLEALEKFRVEDDLAAKKAKGARDPKKGLTASLHRDGEPGRVSDHIGPVQFNMGGIQVDADQMLQTLREREAGRSPPPPDDASVPFALSTDDKDGNEHLRSFFANLASRGGSSAKSSPRAEGK